jgi:hypothetical protein
LRRFLWSSWLFLLILTAQSAYAQNSEKELANRLIGHPLYLRDAWQENRIEFDSHGQPIGDVHRGPVTLSGVDVTGIKLRGNNLEIRGRRVALIARRSGQPLERETAIASTTTIVPSLRPGDGHRFRPAEEVQFTVHSDRDGSFAEALTAIFADGVAQLAKSVPSAWRCYAASYFIDGPVSPSAANDVKHCAETHSSAAQNASDDSLDPPALIQQANTAYTNTAAQLRLSGISEVYVTVQPDGSPADLQVIQALGAGLDEQTLSAFSRSTFRPATRDGRPAPAGLFLQIRYTMQ